jgi:hypothetical protein
MVLRRYHSNQRRWWSSKLWRMGRLCEVFSKGIFHRLTSKKSVNDAQGLEIMTCLNGLVARSSWANGGGSTTSSEPSVLENAQNKAFF